MAQCLHGFNLLLQIDLNFMFSDFRTVIKLENLTSFLLTEKFTFSLKQPGICPQMNHSICKNPIEKALKYHTVYADGLSNHVSIVLNTLSAMGVSEKQLQSYYTVSRLKMKRSFYLPRRIGQKHSIVRNKQLLFWVTLKTKKKRGCRSHARFGKQTR